MDLNSKVTQLEDEIKVLKKEVQAVLLDLRENMLNRENPFSPQPLVAPGVAVTVSTQPPTPAPPPEEKKAPVEEKPQEAPPVKKEEPELPEAITGAFQEDAPALLPARKDNPTAVTASGESVLAWKPVSEGETGLCLPGSKAAGDAKSGKDVLESITSLVDWVESSVARLGYERTQAILDISEMMGHLSAEMKVILVKFMRPGCEPEGKVAFKDYMSSLMELASLLGKKNDPNNVLFYTLYHGMYTTMEGKDRHG